MLHVRVDVVPGGIEAMRHTLTDVYVGNDGTGNREVGHYDVYLSDPRGQDKAGGRDKREGWIGRVENFDRLRGRDALAAAALERAAAIAPDLPSPEDVRGILAGYERR